MSITYDADHRDQIALLLGRGAYSDLKSSQQDAIDDSTLSPPGGAVARALNTLGQYANMYEADDTTTIPDTWLTWFIAETVMQAAPAFPSSDATELRRNLVTAKRDALVAHARQAFDNTDNGDIGAFTIASIRADTMVNALRQQRGSLFLEPSMIDAAIEEVVSEVWNDADWSFKRKQVTLTIATSGAVSSSDSVLVDKIIGDRLYYDSAFGGTCQSVDYETILDYKSSDTSAGKPQYFHLLRDGDDLEWVFDRTPDQEYTAKALVTAQTPAMTSYATMNAGLALFPSDFRAVVKNRVLATCLMRAGRYGVANPLFDETTTKMISLLARYDDPGGQMEQSEVHGVYQQGLGWNPGHIGGGGV
jgi:hypothetical protein